MTIYAEVIGDPISHSKSPLIHRYWLDALGIDANYRAHHVPPDNLAAYVASRRDDPAWRGCNVTIPHKIAIMDHVGDPGGVRDLMGAMNTVARDGTGALFGTNTDAGGFYAPLADTDLQGKPIVVLGAGGAARAILFALSRADVGSVTMLNRNALKGAALLSRFGLKGQSLPLTTAIPPAALVVNASPLGMTGQDAFDPDLSALPDDAIVYDIVYAPLMTGLLRAAERRGLDTIDGLDMLIGQAALAFEIFFDVAPPDDEHHDVALRALLTQG